MALMFNIIFEFIIILEPRFQFYERNKYKHKQ